MRSTTLAALAVGLVLVAAPSSGAQAARAAVAGQPTGGTPTAAAPSRAERERHARIVRFWTAERMRQAIPREEALARVPARRVTRTILNGGPAVVSRPLRGRTVGITPAPVDGASWTGGGRALRATGKVFFTVNGGGFVCSGAVARDSRTGQSLVLTAGHCVYDQAREEFASDWLFVPSWDSGGTSCATTAWGCWTAQGLVVHERFAAAGGLTDDATAHDYAFAVMGPGGTSGTAQLDATVGAFGLSYSRIPLGQRLAAFGYPALGPYHGDDLVWCDGPTFDDPGNDASPWGMTCDMTGGASGGPWFARFARPAASGVLASVNSYGYQGVDSIYGPRFDGTTRRVHAAADAATANLIVR